MRDDDDDALMRLAGAGDRAAFSRLVQRHLTRASRLAVRMVGNASDAEEIVQEAFLRAWLKAPEWKARAETPDAGASFFTWLAHVIVNFSLDRKRRRQTAPLEAAHEVADTAPSAVEMLAARETAARVATAVAALPERQRAALVMCHFEGMSNGEAATALGLSVGAIESLLVRARRALRGALAAFEPDLRGSVPRMTEVKET
jgi:RNA polymerase sigma-70 factor (ECF subfamily)